MQFSAQAATSNTLGGLESVFSQLSYSAAATRACSFVGSFITHISWFITGGGGMQGSTVSGPRSVSGRSVNPQGSLSPLSGPVLTGDDDDLFSMDG